MTICSTIVVLSCDERAWILVEVKDRPRMFQVATARQRSLCRSPCCEDAWSELEFVGDDESTVLARVLHDSVKISRASRENKFKRAAVSRCAKIPNSNHFQSMMENGNLSRGCENRRRRANEKITVVVARARFV